MRERAVLAELHTLPSLDYICMMSQAEHVVLEAHEHYPKQTCRNRYYINTSHGKLRLTVPVDLPGGKIATRAVRLEAGRRWRNQHWRSLEAAYRKAPFFEHYAAELHAIFFDLSTHLLWDLNKKLLSFCLAHLHMPVMISETVSFVHYPAPDILDVRQRVNGLDADGGYTFHRPHPYYQVFGRTFVENSSAIDLLFCLGPQAMHHVRLSRKPLNK